MNIIENSILILRKLPAKTNDIRWMKSEEGTICNLQILDEKFFFLNILPHSAFLEGTIPDGIIERTAFICVESSDEDQVWVSLVDELCSFQSIYFHSLVAAKAQDHVKAVADPCFLKAKELRERFPGSKPLFI